ncbi:MAG: putative nickel-responsive regulator [Promethearchaeota archaeon]|nr:MAG: putative nickel-responsive regulator [Candidatus Lokiarchaeota archaeon]
MSTVEIQNLDSSSTFSDIQETIEGNVIIVIPQDLSIQKKLNKIEEEFKEGIVSKNQHFYKDSISIFMVFEGNLQEFQKLVVEINGIKELKNFRYVILN